MNNQNIIFFDGYCILCNGFIDFLLKVDKRSYLRFSPIHGETAKKILPLNRLQDIESVIFIDEQNRIFSKSVAVITILKTLGGFWKLSILFFIIPRVIRDFIYDWIAQNRYSWFGKRDRCRLASEEEKEKILP